VSTSRLSDRCVAAWLILLFWHARHAPFVLRLLRPPILRGAWLLSPSMRRASLCNAARLLGPAGTASARRRVARAVVANCFDAVVEFGANRERSSEDIAAELVSVEGEEGYLTARRHGRGAILVTAHLGPFESAIAMLRRCEPRVHVVFRRDRMGLFERLRSAQHARLGVIEAPSDDGLNTWIALRDALCRDEVVLMQGDRVMPGQPGVRVPMLGGHMLVPTGPAKLARITGSPLIPVFAVRTPEGVRITMEEAIWPEHCSLSQADRSSPDPAILTLTKTIEHFVQRYPEQWLCLHPVVLEDVVSDGPLP
jgi:lauroyl/myristoyl acyltransferase